MKRKVMLLFACMFTLFCLMAGSKTVCAYERTIAVGETCTLSLDGTKSIVPSSVTWSSSDSRVIAITSHTTATCTVKGVSYDYGSSARITCNYAYLVGGTSIRTSEIFTVSLKNPSSSDSSGGSTMTGDTMYKLVPASSVLTLDQSGKSRCVVHVSAPNFNYATTTRYFQMKAVYDGKYVYVTKDAGWYNHGMDFTFTAKSNVTGTETVRIIMTRDGVQVSYTDIVVTVTCTHKNAMVTTTTEATCQGTGKTVRKCKYCGYSETNTLSRVDHQWILAKTTTATVFSPGVKTFSCKYCGRIKTQQADAQLTPTIGLSARKISLKKGKSYTIKVSGLAAGNRVISWKSSNKKKVTVSKTGKVKAKKRGRAVVTVTLLSGKQEKVTVIVR